MIRSKIKFGEDGTFVDLFDTFRFVHLESDSRFGAPMKEFETTSYAEESGEHIYPKTTPEAFDYKVKFLIMAENNGTTNLNDKVVQFNNSLFKPKENATDDLLEYKQISFYNAYKKVTIVGYPKQPISEVTEFFRDRHTNKSPDMAQAEFVIRVTNPNLCNWNS